MTVRALPEALRSLVRTVEASLGETVRAAAGRRVYQAVETVRRLMAEFRGPAAADFDRLEVLLPKPPREEKQKRRALNRAGGILQRLSPKDKASLAKAYTLYLELVNICENAYRTYRLRRRHDHLGPAKANLVYVLTAHPTESRSPENIAILNRIQQHLVSCLERGRPPQTKTLFHLLRLLWNIGTHPNKKPSVEDEARHIASLLNDDIIDELLTLKRRGHRVRLRTWVGGDKDGHPGVGPDQTQASLQLTRLALTGYLERQLERVRADAALLGSRKFLALRRSLNHALEAAKSLRKNDGIRIAKLQAESATVSAAYQKLVGRPHPALERFALLLDIFPALVLPLELREERGLFEKGSTIEAMLKRVRDIAKGGGVGAYVRGLVVSMAESPDDLEDAAQLVKRTFGGPEVPIIPLFEMPHIMRRAAQILEAASRRPAFKAGIQARRNRQEVMLGYSDTAKRMGSLPSRLVIHDAMADIGAWAKRKRIQIIFFHGSGGSEGRGGGSIHEQAASWPKGALETVKMTLQGEMVERTLASPEILRSQVLKVAEVQMKPPLQGRVSRFTRDLAEQTEAAYRELVAAQDFKDFIAKATPYTRLGALNIGSRPARRKGTQTLETLRAIPWVLCWTQTRYLLTVWYGLGSAWQSQKNHRKLRAAIQKDPLLRGFLRVNAFALSKAAPRIFRRYADTLAPRTPEWLMSRLKSEWVSAVALTKAASPQGLLADRRWLKESIYFRAPMIHPLNLLQIQLLAKKSWTKTEELLFRETVTGIAAGMLTTG